MAFFEWTDELSVGIELIDSQHKRLVSIINDFHNAADKGDTKSAIRKVVGTLIYYVGTHFADEEKLMEEYKYPQLGLHRRMHEYLTQQVAEYAEKLKAEQPILNLDMAIFLKGWLQDHIAETDKKYGIHIAQQKK